MKLYSGPLSMFGAKAQIAAHEKGIAFDLDMVPFDMRALYQPKHPEVLRINPKRQVPVLVDGDVEIFDSTQIFEYLEDRWPSPRLWGLTPADRARARLLELKSDEVFFPHVIRLMGLQDRPDHPDRGPACAAIARFYDDMNAALADREFLAGTYSYADIAFFMAQFFAARMGAPMSAGLARLSDWRIRVRRRPAVAEVVGAMEAFLRQANRPLPTYD
ncbi:MAG: glutathione S-transferase family protein [Alphaproteobacteria bacterium]|nr:glutathione S-transferase family protein [Alphaproteobacteria bacterium]